MNREGELAMAEDLGDVTVRVANVSHDLLTKKSYVKLVWPSDDRRLHLPIPFGTELEGVHAAAQHALREHERNIAKTSVALD
jgi:hypothetical protein